MPWSTGCGKPCQRFPSQRLLVDTEQEFEAGRTSVEGRFGAFNEEDETALPATKRTKGEWDATTANPLSTTADERESDVFETLLETLLPDKQSAKTRIVPKAAALTPTANASATAQAASAPAAPNTVVQIFNSAIFFLIALDCLGGLFEAVAG